MMNKFLDWVTDVLCQWLEDHIKAVVLQIIVASVIEIGNITIIDWFVYAYLKWTEAEAIVSQIYILDVMLTAIYFFMFGVSYVTKQIRYRI